MIAIDADTIPVEFLGYVVRAAARQNTSSLGAYAIQNLLLLVAPALFAATIYMTLSRVIRQLGASHLSIINPAKLTRLFVWGDVICFWIQGGAAPLQAIQDVPILPVIGKWVVVAGLVLQVALFGFFVVVAGKFHRALLASPTTSSMAPGNQWQRIMTVLYGSSLLIFIRNCVRVAEYAEGFTGWIIRHEAMLFVFDALPMVLLLAALIIWHPARMLTASHAPLEASGEEGIRLNDGEEGVRTNDKGVPNVRQSYH